MKRKVLLATRLKIDDVKRLLPQVLSEYGHSTALDEVGFIIFDLDHPPDDWAAYLHKEEPPEAVAIDTTPCFFLAHGGRNGVEDPAGKAALDQVKKILHYEPKIIENDDQLLKELRDLQRHIRGMETAVQEIRRTALTKLKESLVTSGKTNQE